MYKDLYQMLQPFSNFLSKKLVPLCPQRKNKENIISNQILIYFSHGLCKIKLDFIISLSNLIKFHTDEGDTYLKSYWFSQSANIVRCMHYPVLYFLFHSSLNLS